jgi:predicted amidophosphoribosyltransferase
MNSIVSLGTYYPSKHQGNKSKFSQMILCLKSRLPFAVAYFTKALQNHLTATGQTRLLCTVPSHDPDKVNGITLVARKLAASVPGFVDGTDAIQRTAMAESFCKTGNRSENSLKSTITISDKVLNAHIILLDDIVSTGTSLNTLEQMLMDAGAASVTKLACARTFLC